MPVLCDGSLAQQYHCKGQLIHCPRCTGKSWSVQGDLHREWWLLLMQPPHLNGQGFPADEKEIMTWHKNYNKIISDHFLYPQIYNLNLECRDPPPCSHFILTMHPYLGHWHHIAMCILLAPRAWTSSHLTHYRQSSEEVEVSSSSWAFFLLIFLKEWNSVTHLPPSRNRKCSHKAMNYL